MALQIGRVGIDVALDNPEVWDWTGETVQVSGELFAATIHDAKVLRQQLLGHVNNPDESIVPVVWSEDSHADGFYRVLSAEVSTVAGSYSAFWFPFNVTLQRIPDYAAPLIESILIAPPLVRSNSMAVPNSRAFHGLPVAAVSRSEQGTSATLTADSGNVDVRFRDTGVAATTLTDGVETFMLPVADWYDAAARIELDYAGTAAFRTATGRQIPNLPGELRWRLSNGIIRVTLEDPTSLILGVSRWTGSAWSTPTEFFVGSASAGTRTPWAAPVTITVLRNSPEEVIVRLGVPPPSAFLAPNVDLTLKRGTPFVEINMGDQFGNTGSSGEHSVGRSTNQAGTVFTVTGTEANLNIAGMKATTADGNGFKYMVATVRTITNSRTTEGFIGATFAPTTLPPIFAIGLSTDTGTADAPTRPEGNALQFFAAQSETMRVVER